MTSDPPVSSARSASFEWQKHLGLLVGVATSAIICLKLLAVANWDMNTAVGILAANGTANVLTGTLLTVLPVLYGAFALAVAPRIERRLKQRTPVERAAARLLETWPAFLVALIAPLGLILILLGYTLLVVVIAFVRRLLLLDDVREFFRPLR